MSTKTEINGHTLAVDGIVLIRRADEFSFFDIKDVPNGYTPQATVHTLSQRPIPAHRSVNELAMVLGFVVVVSGTKPVALNPNFAHYHVAQVTEDDHYRRGQKTVVSWKVNGAERKVFVNESVEDVLALLPKTAAHLSKAAEHPPTENLHSERPHAVREAKPSEPGTDVA